MDAATAWSGWGSSLLGGLLGGLVVFGGIWWSQRLSDKSTDERARYEAAALLVEQISHLRDLAYHSTPENVADVDIWPLRNQVLMSTYLFTDRRPMEYAREFALKAQNYRNWMRDLLKSLDPGEKVDIPSQPNAIDYVMALDGHAEKLMALLQDLRDPKALDAYKAPNYPQLTWSVPRTPGEPGS